MVEVKTKTKRYPIGDTILSALLAMRARCIADDEKEAADNIQYIIDTPIGDMADLLKENPDIITDALMQVICVCIGKLETYTESDDWYNFYERELSASKAAYEHIIKIITETNNG